MATLGLIEYKDASAEVQMVYDDIMATRKTDWINNFWKALAHDPATLRRTWAMLAAQGRSRPAPDRRSDRPHLGGVHAAGLPADPQPRSDRPGAPGDLGADALRRRARRVSVHAPGHPHRRP